MRTYINIVGLFVSFVIVTSCTQKTQTLENRSEWIEISKEQYENDGMQIGSLQKMLFESVVNTNATVVSSPNGTAKVHSAVSGTVQAIYARNGDFVSKNQVLLEISGNEVFDLQKEFLESSAVFNRMKNEFGRVKVLYEEKVLSEKEFVNAESEYRIALARYQALKLKVEMVGFSVVEIEAGRFYNTYKLRSPIEGRIVNLNTSVAAYVEPQTELIEIVNSKTLQLRLSVFTSDIHKIKNNQTVRVKSVNSGNVYTANIQSVGVAVDEPTKTVECYAVFNQNNSSAFIANDFLKADIVVGKDSVMALPSEAIIKAETGNMVLNLEKFENDIYYFKKIDVKVGRNFNGFVELNNTDLNDSLLVRGVYNIVF